jgi:uncharacterized membrane protein
MRRHILIVAVLSAGLSGCVWVKLEPGAAAVRVAMPGENLDHCMKAGEIAVSVKANVAAYHRNPLKVKDELETMARNEARGLSADTIKALGEPISGEQRFVALRCGGQHPDKQTPPPERGQDGDSAEVIPLRDQ